MKKIVAIVPCFNEEGTLPYLVEAIGSIREGLKPKYNLDLLIVNDGSNDSTQSVIEKLRSKHQYIYWREFAHNAGHQAALRAGLNVCQSYDAVVMLDADMQHPPELIKSMLSVWEEGSKIIQMVRDDSARDAGTLKYATSKGYYWFINKISGLNLHYGASDFRLIDRTIVETIAKSKESDLFLRGYFSWLPVPSTVIKYKPNKRIAGKSKYSLRKMLDLAYKGVLQFSERPLQLSVAIGIVLALVSFIYGIVLIIQKLTGASTVSGWTSVMVVTLFCFGINFILLGIIGAYLAHALRLEKQRPEFIIQSEKLPEF